jgi:hypothetical protein
LLFVCCFVCCLFAVCLLFWLLCCARCRPPTRRLSECSGPSLPTAARRNSVGDRRNSVSSAKSESSSEGGLSHTSPSRHSSRLAAPLGRFDSIRFDCMRCGAFIAMSLNSEPPAVGMTASAAVRQAMAAAKGLGCPLMVSPPAQAIQLRKTARYKPKSQAMPTKAPAAE